MVRSWHGGENDEDGAMMILTDVMVVTIMAKLMMMKVEIIFIVGV